MGVAEEIVTAAFTLILGAAALAVGLAFGLGNRELAGEITRRWYEEGQRRERETCKGEGGDADHGAYRRLVVERSISSVVVMTFEFAW